MTISNSYLEYIDPRPPSENHNDDHHKLTIVSTFQYNFLTEREVSRKTKMKKTLDVEEQALFQHYLWKYITHFRFGVYIIQHSTAQLCSSIIGTRPGVILENRVSAANERASSVLGSVSQNPELVTFDADPHIACWQKIELFYLPSGDGVDLLCAIIEFRK